MGIASCCYRKGLSNGSNDMNDDQKNHNRSKEAGPQHPDHSAQVTAINRVIGQLEAIKKMMIDRKYCPEIIHQMKAARGGLVTAEVSVLATHISNCVHQAVLSKDDDEIEAKTSEVVKYVRSLIG